MENLKNDNLLIYRFMNQEDDIYTPELKKYSFDWNSLMNVVDRIESLEYRVIIKSTICIIETTDDLNSDYYKMITSNVSNLKFKSVYWSVVDFINHYNNIKNSVGF